MEFARDISGRVILLDVGFREPILLQLKKAVLSDFFTCMERFLYFYCGWLANKNSDLEITTDVQASTLEKILALTKFYLPTQNYIIIKIQ